MAQHVPVNPPFDVRAFARTAVGCHRDQLDLDHYDTRPLAPDILRVLGGIRDLERATMRYLRDVLVTPTHKEPAVTAFLTTWAFEKYWVADALEVILDRHAYRPLTVAAGEPSWSAAWRRARHRLAPVWRSLADNVVGEDTIAVHMVSGAIGEWTVDAAYRRLTEVEHHPILADTVTTITDIKSRHLAYFEGQARQRLHRSARARRLVRARLRRRGWPASGYDSRTAAAYAMIRGFTATPALTAEFAGRIRALPGMAALADIPATRWAHGL